MLPLILTSGPVAWFTVLSLNYVLSSRRCGPGLPVVLQTVAGLMLLMVAGAIVLSWRQLAAARAAQPDATVPSGRPTFLAGVALLGNLLFAIAIAAQALAPAMVDDCY